MRIKRIGRIRADSFSVERCALLIIKSYHTILESPTCFYKPLVECCRKPTKVVTGIYTGNKLLKTLLFCKESQAYDMILTF